MDLKLTQMKAGKIISVDKTNVQFWENNRVKPFLRMIPRIIEFFGYNPYECAPRSLGEEIVAFRRRQGLSQKKLADLLAIDSTTVGSWERGENRPSKQLLDKLTPTASLLSFIPLRAEEIIPGR